MTKQTPIDKYIKSFPEDVRLILQKIQEHIKKAAPQAEEIISYGMPTFDIDKTHLVHFAAFKKHIGFYPTPSPILAFQKDLSAYKTSKGAIQFPLDKPIPYALIKKLVAFRLKEIRSQAPKVCSRGHEYNGRGPCPKCWPGKIKK